MTAMMLILVGLQLAVPVRCYQTPPAWQAAKHAAHAPADAAAFYAPVTSDAAHAAGGPYIALGHHACRAVRQATVWGAFVLGHEFAHHWQDRTGRPFDEAEADRIGWRKHRWWKTRLSAHLRLRPAPPVVRLAP